MGDVIDMTDRLPEPEPAHGAVYVAVKGYHSSCGGLATIETPTERSLHCTVHGLLWRAPRDQSGTGVMSEIKQWPDDEAPLQSVPETGSDERQHVLDGTCWCRPDVLTAVGGGRVLLHQTVADEET